MQFSKESLLPDVRYKVSRSGGKGGQNVNKVSSKVELNFDLASSAVFNDAQKARLYEKLAGRLTSGRMLQVICEQERSQHQNKEQCFDKLCQLISNALYEPKKRKASKPARSAKEQRLKEKQLQALKKLSRRKDFF